MAHKLFRKKTVEQIQKDTYHQGSGGLAKVLGVKDLVSLGIAAIVGAGIFSTIGLASYNGGPAVSLLFVFTAIACVFTALSYAQFASTVPVSGSAYTYAYVAFGEIFAWIIGWALILEYAVSNMVVAISWSEYFVSMLKGFGIRLPLWLTTSSEGAYEAFHKLQQAGSEALSSSEKIAAAAYEQAPHLGNIALVCNLPAGLITILVTWLVYIGIKESRTASNIMVILKVSVVLFVIIGGAFYVKPANWSPFAPNGIQGILSGVAAVFFAFIGFDSISTTAEECKNPQRDLPRAMIYCLLICTVLYVLITLVLTGMVNYKELNVNDPLAFVFQSTGLDFMAGVISISSVIAITSALLVFQLGQPRIWMTMSRDGLLWKKFASIHPKYKTPGFATIIAGIVVTIPALFFRMDFFVDLTSVGTFFAFILVCGGVLYLDHQGISKQSKFRVPYVNGKYIVGLALLITVLGLFIYGKATIKEWVDLSAVELIEHKSLTIIFWLTWVILTVLSYKYNFSTLPVAGILVNLYLMTELGASNWIIFIGWLVIGLIIYFIYGYRKSKLNVSHRALGDKL
ncbi:amino acid permease [Olivibacter sp. 47]|uniref:amino acid permease n=1 Tax=Olivibacter sp. 47 TaxID=3056486 RepID=UPI0025A44FED|nr:amino acid permease [Olivibacter sp. 47]MDM8175644.1 amino acid permease [Olivibacter sp. 47]